MYLALQFQESFDQLARATMDEINRTSGRTLGRVVPSQCPDHYLSSSERKTRAKVPTGPTRGETTLRSRVVDVRKNLAVRNLFLQVAAEHPRACVNGMSWNPAISNQAIPPGSRHLIVRDSLVRDLNEIFWSGQTTVLSFGGASVAQVINMMEFQGEDQLDTLVIMLGTNDVSRAPVIPEGRWEPLLVCLLNELKENYRPRLVVLLCIIPLNPEVGTPVADFMNGNVTRRNDMTRNLVRRYPSELRLMDLKNTLRMTDHLALTRYGIPLNTAQGRRWINDVFQTKIEEMEQELRTNDSLARTSSTGGCIVRGNLPETLGSRLGPVAMETGAIAPIAPSSDVRERLGTAPPPRRQPLESRLGRPIDQIQISCQTVAKTRNPPATSPAPAGSHRRVPRRRRELSQTVCCSGTVQIPAVGAI